MRMYIYVSRARLELFAFNDDDVRGNVRALTYRDRRARKGPILNKAMRDANAFYIYEGVYRAPLGALCTETAPLLIYGGRASLFQFNFPRCATRRSDIRV